MTDDQNTNNDRDWAAIAAEFEADLELDAFCAWFQLMTGHAIGLCDTHGWVKITNWGHNAGFAGEGFYWVNYECGCTLAEGGYYA